MRQLRLIRVRMIDRSQVLFQNPHGAAKRRLRITFVNFLDKAVDVAP